MRSALFLALLLSAFAVVSQETTPASFDLHPEVLRILQGYPPLQKGGYRIEKFDEDRYIVLGVGKAPLKSGFLRAARAAELDAEVQIAKAVNPTEMTVEHHREKSSAVSSSGEAESRVVRGKFVKMLVSSHTPFIVSCGMWKSGSTLFCARAVFVGEFEHKNAQAKTGALVSDPSGKPEALSLIDGYPYLRSGGTILLRDGETPLLLTVALAPAAMPPGSKLTYARNQAYRNLIAFVSGGKLDQQLTVITQSVSDKNGENQSRRTKRKNLESAIKGEFQFIEPQAQWRLADGEADCFLYLVKLSAALL